MPLGEHTKLFDKMSLCDMLCKIQNGSKTKENQAIRGINICVIEPFDHEWKCENYKLSASERAKFCEECIAKWLSK